MVAAAVTRPSGSSHLPTPDAWFADHPASGRTELACLPGRIEGELLAELRGARAQLEAGAEEILLAALGKAVARTMGGGLLRVDVETADAVPARIALLCDGHRGMAAREALAAARHALAGATAPDADGADIAFRYGCGAPDVAISGDYVLSLRLWGDIADSLVVEWWFDGSRFDRNTIEELSDQFGLALIAVTSG